MVAGKDIKTRYTVDPFVEVSVYVPDWSTSPFLPPPIGSKAPVYSPPSGPNTSTSPRPSTSDSSDFAPASVTASYAPGESSSGAKSDNAGASTARVISHVTSVVKNNGFNPVWQEQMSIPFDCVGDMMDLIFVKLQVKDEYNDEEVAVFCAPLGGLRQGALKQHNSVRDGHITESRHLYRFPSSPTA